MSTPVRQAIFGALSTDGTLSGLLSGSAAIYYHVAPQKADFPYVVFSKQAGTPVYSFGDRAWEDQVWQVKGVVDTTAAKVDAIALRLDQVLTNAALTISGGATVYLKRESDVDFAEVTDGVRYLHAGGMFRLVHQ